MEWIWIMMCTITGSIILRVPLWNFALGLNLRASLAENEKLTSSYDFCDIPKHNQYELHFFKCIRYLMVVI